MRRETITISRRSWLLAAGRLGGATAWAGIAGCAEPPSASIPPRAPIPPPLPAPARCRRRLTEASLDEAIALGTGFLLRNQREAGNFAYTYDWRARRDEPGDSPVRQAGALWGLSLLHARDPTPELKQALRRGFAFFARHRATTADGAAFIRYPGFDLGRLGTVALLALAYLDWLRVSPRGEASGDEPELRSLIRFVLRARRERGRFHQSYRRSGRPYGAPSPYFDGEALLLLVRASAWFEDEAMAETALEEAEIGWRHNVVAALGDDPDSDVTKGYYQWCSMAYAELAKSHPRFGGRLTQLAVWMIDVHRTLARSRNTAYAYEGIVVAHEEARRRGDESLSRKLGCTIEEGLDKLMSWQVGFSGANDFIRDGFRGDDPRARGGVQNHAREPALRIDVTQHQMHALLLARERYLPHRCLLGGDDCRRARLRPT